MSAQRDQIIRATSAGNTPKGLRIAGPLECAESHYDSTPPVIHAYVFVTLHNTLHKLEHSLYGCIPYRPGYLAKAVLLRSQPITSGTGKLLQVWHDGMRVNSDLIIPLLHRCLLDLSNA